MQSHLLFTVLSIISSTAFITYYVCISFLLSAIITLCPYDKFMKKFLKQSLGPYWLLRVGGWRKLQRTTRFQLIRFGQIQEFDQRQWFTGSGLNCSMVALFCSIKQWLHLSPEKLQFSPVIIQRMEEWIAWFFKSRKFSLGILHYYICLL